MMNAEKTVLRTVIGICLLVLCFSLGQRVQRHDDTAKWSNEPRMAAGEWKIEVQTPPCDNVHNMEVIYPKESGAPISIECNAMPVPTK